METINSLKDIAMNAATGNVFNTMESEIPTKEEMAAFGSPAVSETANATEVEYVGNTPVIIAPPKKEFGNPMKDLMSTPTPSAIGLDTDTLKAPQMNVDLSPISKNSGTLQNMPYPEYMDMLQEIMPDIDPSDRIKIAKPILDTKDSIKKDLIINGGLTPDEANIAVNNQLRKKISDAYEKHNDKSTDEVGTVVINKTDDPNNLGLTKEEHLKLEKVKKVRLVLVEDMDLANITIERPAEEHKADYVKSIEGSLSKYSVPMPMFGDFLSFRGAPMIQLVNTVNYEDARIDEIISTKASLIYEKLIGGCVLQKYDTTGKNTLSYNEFANKFAYQDIDMALYGILCASSMEENSTSLTCQSCSHQWMQNYNLKSLLKLDGLSEVFKGRVDEVLKNKSNDIEMRKLYEGMRKAKRFKSPFTNNIYDLSYPTIARATNLLKRINPDDDVMTYLSAVALYLSRILIYNEAKGTYVEITADETPLMLETMKSLSNEDINMLTTQIREDLYYTTQFILHARCPECGKESDIPVNIEHLIFLTARDSMVEIDS